MTTTSNDSSTTEIAERASKRPKAGNENGNGESGEGKISNDNKLNAAGKFDDLLAAWKREESPEIKIKAFQALMKHCGKELEWLIGAGIEASQLCSSLDSQVGQLQQEVKVKDEQLKALAKIKDDQSKTIQVRRKPTI